jgi:osmotically-inducible protein OsmY
MTDREIQQAVLEALDWEPQVTSTRIGVSVQDGVVALSGCVDSDNTRHHAGQAARRVYGVTAVANDLEVQPGAGRLRSDPAIFREAVQTLASHTAVPHNRIRVTVREGWIILEGDVDWKYQREAAESVVRYLCGVRGVTNRITVKPAVADQPTVSAAEVKSEIEGALRRNAEWDAHRIQVETANSKVILRGSVRTWVERDDAEQAAWRAPGVTRVENRILIVP